MQLANAVLSAVLNVILLALVPFLCYWLYQKILRKRSLAEIRRRAGLQRSPARYIGYGVLLAAATVVALVVWEPPLEPLTRKGSAQFEFVGLGLNGTSILLALIYGVVKTGFPEEFLFRGLIAGSLSRRLPFWWANLIQALIFLAPHLLLLKIMPEAWPMFPLLFVASLVLGWMRIRSGSIVSPMIAHAVANVATCLSVAARTG